MEFTTETTGKTKPEITLALDELARAGARRMLALALQAEVDDYVTKRQDQQDEQGHALVVRNGRAQERTVLLGVGPVQVKAPRVHDRRPGCRFSSRILPPYMRRSPCVEEVLPVLYLRGLSTGDFAEALEALLGPDAAGLSATTVTRLLRVWQDEYQSWRQRSLQGKDYVYIWADGVYFNVRLGEDRLACLVVIGALPDGRKEVVALEEGYRESAESWASLLRDVKRRGLPAPVLATGDGALGFWVALHDVYPVTRAQRCWVHKIANVLDKVPKRLHGRAKALLQQVMGAPDRQSALRQIELFRQEFASRYPKAADCLSADAETLLTFFDFPAEHWLHLRTTNPIESPFASVKVRTRKTKGAGSRPAGVALAFKLLLNAERHWHKVTAPHLIALLRAGVPFKDGVQISSPAAEQNQDTPHVETERIAA